MVPVALVGFVMVSVPASVLQPRQSLCAISPDACDVLRDVESERGSKVPEGELPHLIQSPDFQKRVGEKARHRPIACGVVPCEKANQDSHMSPSSTVSG